VATRLPLNCLIVAFWLWLASLGGRRRRYLWFRRSYPFRGALPHSGIGEGIAWRTFTVVEYIPNKSQLGTRNNLVVLFRGRYRVWRFRVESVRRFDHRADALTFAGLHHDRKNHHPR